MPLLADRPAQFSDDVAIRCRRAACEISRRLRRGGTWTIGSGAVVSPQVSCTVPHHLRYGSYPPRI